MEHQVFEIEDNSNDEPIPKRNDIKTKENPLLIQ